MKASDVEHARALLAVARTLLSEANRNAGVQNVPDARECAAAAVRVLDVIAAITAKPSE